MHLRLYLLLVPFALSACEQLGLDDQAKIAAAREADGKAVGGACRQTDRALEDCYSLNPKAQKAAIFAGWRDMDGYMRENKIESIKPPMPEAKPADQQPGADKSKESGNAGKTKEMGGAAKPAAKH